MSDQQGWTYTSEDGTYAVDKFTDEFFTKATKTFQAKRSTAKFCCSTCRSASNRKVHAAANSL